MGVRHQHSQAPVQSDTTMLVSISFLLLVPLAYGEAAGSLQMRLYKGLDKQVEITPEVRTALRDLNRYCGTNNGYSYYRPTSYRPTSYYRPTGPNLGSLVGPAVFGLAAAGVGAALANLIGK